jgi:hypothetical protein
MHRSGTSALAGALESMGYEVGPDDDVMPADDGNPEGYFELLSIVRANDDLLAHFGGRWDSPPEFGPDWTHDDAAREFVDAARAMIGELFESDHYLLKDPRISLLLPVWRQITNDRGCAVVIVRDPFEVAASLTRRDGIPTLTGLALWAAYNRAMLRDLEGARVHICSYADLIENPVKILTEISESLRAWGEFSDDLDLSKAVTSIRPELRRNTASAELHTEASPLDITELMKLVLDLRGRHDAFDLGTVLEPGWWEGPLLEERRVLLQWALGAIAELETHNTNLLTENAILWQRSEEATREADRLRERIAGVRRLVPGPLYSLVTKLTRRS